MKRVALAALVALAGCSTSSDPTQLQPQDFASGFTLTPPGQAPFFRIDLPENVYTGTAWPDLRDVRVFNGNGELVPFSRVVPPRPRGQERRVALHSFELSMPPSPGTPSVGLQTREGGLELRMVVTPDQSSPTAEYILATPEDEPSGSVERLELHWDERPDNWQQRVAVWASLDLQVWAVASPGSPVMDLKTDEGQRLVQNEVAVRVEGTRRVRYWRIRFDPGTAPRLSGVDAVFRESEPPPPGVTLRVGGTGGPDGIVYRLPNAQPVASVRITPAEPNSVLPVAVDGRSGPEAPWRLLARTVAYRLNASDATGERRSDAVPVGGATVSEIRLRSIGAPITRIPNLEVERSAVVLVVNARGAGPFLLAWGCRAAADATVPLGTLVPGHVEDTPLDFPYAKLAASPQTLGGPSRLTDPGPSERAARSNVVLVWAGLVAGAGALAFLALRVWKESRGTAA